MSNGRGQATTEPKQTSSITMKFAHDTRKQRTTKNHRVRQRETNSFADCGVACARGSTAPVCPRTCVELPHLSTVNHPSAPSAAATFKGCAFRLPFSAEGRCVQGLQYQGRARHHGGNCELLRSSYFPTRGKKAHLRRSYILHVKWCVYSIGLERGATLRCSPFFVTSCYGVVCRVVYYTLYSAFDFCVFSLGCFRIVETKRHPKCLGDAETVPCTNAPFPSVLPLFYRCFSSNARLQRPASTVFVHQLRWEHLALASQPW